MPLKIHLRKGDRLLLNGTVMRSTCKSELVIERPAVRLMYGKMVLEPEKATTTLLQLYEALQNAYAGESDEELRVTWINKIPRLITDIRRATNDAELTVTLEDMEEELEAGKLYPALGLLYRFFQTRGIDFPVWRNLNDW